MHTPTRAHLRALDLNLLVSLAVLLKHCNVTHAATALGMSQPALSAQLNKIRHWFGDDILMPAESGRGMVMTAFATRLYPTLQDVLKQIEGLAYFQTAFEPEQDERTFTIAASDYSIAVVGQLLIAQLEQKAYHKIRLAFIDDDAKTIAQQLESNEVDLLIGSERMVPPQMKAKLLFEEHFVMVQRKGHPRGSAPIDLPGYCALSHVLVSTSGGSFFGFMDEQLQTLGHRRRVALSLMQFAPLPQILCTTNYVCTLPKRFAQMHTEKWDIFELPFPAPSFKLYAAWHPRNHHEPGLSWLRSQLKLATEM